MFNDVACHCGPVESACPAPASSVEGMSQPSQSERPPSESAPVATKPVRTDRSPETVVLTRAGDHRAPPSARSSARSANGAPSSLRHPRAAPNRAAASAGRPSHARYVPGRPKALACAAQTASPPSAPPRLPRFTPVSAMKMRLSSGQTRSRAVAVAADEQTLHVVLKPASAQTPSHLAILIPASSPITSRENGPLGMIPEQEPPSQTSTPASD